MFQFGSFSTNFGGQGELAKRLVTDPEATLALKGPALELFCFKRICFDEFHEILDLKQGGAGSLASIACEAIRLLRAPRRWGLTATPKLGSAEDIRRIAEVLHVFVPPDSHAEVQTH